MMKITIYSFLNTLLYFNVLCLFMIILTSFNMIITNISSKTLLSILLIVILKPLICFEILNYTKVIRSFYIIPKIQYIFLFDLGLFSTKINLLMILILVWLIGTIIFLGRLFSTYYRLSAKLKYIPETQNEAIQNILLNIKASKNYKFKTRVIQSSLVSGPLEYGLFVQTILLPAYNYENNDYEELDIILRHELCHFANKTNWVKLLINITQCFLWWNPIFIFLTRKSDLILEMYCDSKVLSKRSIDYNIKYKDCILRTTYQGKRTKILSGFASANLNKVEFNKRLNMISNISKKNKAFNTFLIVLALSLTTVQLGYIFQPTYLPPEEELMPVTLTAENTIVVFDGELYNIYIDGELLIVEHELHLSLKDIPVRYANKKGYSFKTGRNPTDFSVVHVSHN